MGKVNGFHFDTGRVLQTRNGMADLRNLWYGFVGKGTINKVDWNEGSTTSTDLVGRAKQGSLDLRSLWEDP